MCPQDDQVRPPFVGLRGNGIGDQSSRVRALDQACHAQYPGGLEAVHRPDQDLLAVGHDLLQEVCRIAIAHVEEEITVIHHKQGLDVCAARPGKNNGMVDRERR